MNNEKYITKIIQCFEISSLYDLEELDNIIGSIRTEVIGECITTLKDSYPLVDDNDILYGFGCAIHRLEQLKGAE